MNNPLIRLFRSKIYTAFVLLFVLICIGIIGYRTISGLSWINAVYMTVITITTVGNSNNNDENKGVHSNKTINNKTNDGKLFGVKLRKIQKEVKHNTAVVDDNCNGAVV